MPTLISFFLMLKLSMLWCYLVISRCLISLTDNVYQDGDMVINVFLPLYTYQTKLTEGTENTDIHQWTSPNNYQFVMALKFAIEEINTNAIILPNMSLGYSIYTAGPSQKDTMLSFLIWLTGQDKTLPNYNCKREEKSVAVITGTTWEISSIIGTLLGLYKHPQLTLGSFEPNMNDPGKFPSLYQIASKDSSLALGMVSLITHFRWNWIGLVFSDDEKGVHFVSELIPEMERNGIYLAFIEMIPVDHMFSIIESNVYYSPIARNSVKVVIIYGNTDSSLGVLFRTWEHIFPWRIWVTTSKWEVISAMRHFILDSFHGTLIFSQHHGEISTFKEFVKAVNPSKYPDDIFLSRLWEIYFDCAISNATCKSLKYCSSRGSLEFLPWYHFDMEMSDGSYHVYNAVYAVAHTLHKMHIQQVDIHGMKNRGRMKFAPWKLNHILKNIQFMNPNGDPVTLNPSQNLYVEYDILNFWNFPQGLGYKVKVVMFSPYMPNGKKLSLTEERIEWSIGLGQTPMSVCSESCRPGFRKSLQDGKALCCFDCSLCPENEISNGTVKCTHFRRDVDHCVKCPDGQYANMERRHCLEKTVTYLAYEDPLRMTLACMTLCFSTITTLILVVFVKYRKTPVVKANNSTLSYILLISLTFCFFCSFLFIGQPNTATCILQQTTFGVAFTVAVSTILAKTITVIMAFKSTTPGKRMRGFLRSEAPKFIIPTCTLIQIFFSGIWLVTSPPFVDEDAHSHHDQIIILCNKGSATAFYCNLGYLGVLSLGSFIVAFLARNLPDTFNEAKFLTFIMLVFCSVWITFLPVYYSTKGNVMVAVEIFSILASSAGILGCIFIPKFYIIFMRPEKNSLKSMRPRFQWK
ncbi:vomeronasal type-2 receptor 116-like [Grammomys surdaster]|uniref:vomeronasal type-2 receptor 116-like n=1 Tax=Grammomys surdaster TaxID=491861 RepID=UPI0010A00784|nr:vomeronasal type-2 receptor 116-like [Grammomys surdaster]